MLHLMRKNPFNNFFRNEDKMILKGLLHYVTDINYQI